MKPLDKAQRERVYKSVSVKVSKVAGEKKFSPFNTVSRDSRDSYLLRVTNEPNVGTNYNPKFSLTLPLHRRSTIDHAPFQRIIGDVRSEDPSVEFSTLEHKCHKSHELSSHRPLTVSETHQWRRTLEHFDFSKQQDSKRLELPKKLSAEESTREDFMHALQTVTESNFNNYKRFSFKPREHKSHSFQSDSAHQYLKEVETREKSPEYDILAINESFAHRSMPKTKGEKRFYLYKEKIATRFDRADKEWLTFLDYDAKERHRLHNAVDFDQTLPRRENEVHSSYPIRLSLSRPLRVRD